MGNGTNKVDIMNMVNMIVVVNMVNLVNMVDMVNMFDTVNMVNMVDEYMADVLIVDMVKHFQQHTKQWL